MPWPASHGDALRAERTGACSHPVVHIQQAATTDEVFWNPNIRAPICFNPQAAKTFLPIFLMKTKLVLAGKSKAEILEATKSAFEKQELPRLEPGAMC